MKLHLASLDTGEMDLKELLECRPPYVLGSYYYLRKLNKPDLLMYFNYVNSTNCRHFILDSGAFTLLESHKHDKDNFNKDIEKYADEYITFVKKWKIKNFIELDLDTIIGYQEVKKLTAYIEKSVGRRSIPVFHGGYRSIKDLDDMLDRYDYICLSSWKRNKKVTLNQYLRMVVLYANKKGAKVHGLALTGKRVTTEVPELYSIDSSSWKTGARYGSIPFYDEKTKSIKNVTTETTKKVDLSKEGMYKIHLHSIKEWLRYVHYLDRKICL